MTVKGETLENFAAWLQCEAGCLEESCITEGKSPANFRILSGTQPSREDTNFEVPWGCFSEPFGRLGDPVEALWGPSQAKTEKQKNKKKTCLNQKTRLNKKTHTKWEAGGTQRTLQAPQSWYSSRRGPPNGCHLGVPETPFIGICRSLFFTNTIV